MVSVTARKIRDHQGRERASAANAGSKIYTGYLISYPVVIEAENERSVHLNSVVMHDAHSAGVVGSLWSLFVRVSQIVIRERFEADKYSGASSEGHIANETQVVGHINGNGSAPNFVQRTQRRA